jgi:hypothetical protein
MTTKQRGASEMKITTIGIDLAKEVFQIHGVDEHGKAVLRKQLKRKDMAKYFANLEPCLIGMEACGSAHHWARKLGEYGHTAKLMAPQFVKPYVKTNKNDVADAEAICEAVGRPNMRFVPIKNVEQQAILSVHRARQGFVKARTAQGNQIRGLLAEFGIVIQKGIDAIAKRVPEILEDAENGLPGTMRRLLERLTDNLKKWIARRMSWKRRYGRGITKTQPAGSWRIFPGSGRSRPAPSWLLWAMPANSRMAVRWRRGWGWFRGSVPAVGNSYCWASANAAIPTCVPC